MELYNDDCFNVFDKIEKKSIDLVVVDLPYGQTACDWDIKIDLNKMWECLIPICKSNCIFVFFTTTKFGNDIINSKPKWFRYDLVWSKTNSVGFLSCNKMPLRQHEMIYVFSNPSGGKKTYNPQKTQGKPYINPKTADCKLYKAKRTLSKSITGDRHPTSILNIKNSNHNSLHPTQKPVDLLDFLIKSYSNEGETVLDFCMGSGSTGEACKNTNRNFIGIEKNEEFYKIAEERLGFTKSL
jgi:site-specific DNA-methyltransferase (adenine-specific)